MLTFADVFLWFGRRLKTPSSPLAFARTTPTDKLNKLKLALSTFSGNVSSLATG